MFLDLSSNLLLSSDHLEPVALFTSVLVFEVSALHCSWVTMYSTLILFWIHSLLWHIKDPVCWFFKRSNVQMCLDPVYSKEFFPWIHLLCLFVWLSANKSHVYFLSKDIFKLVAQFSCSTSNHDPSYDLFLF